MKSVIQKIVDEASKRGHDVTIRNIAYALMRVKFEDKLTAYTVIHGAAPETDADVDCYDEMDSVQFLIRYFEKDLAPQIIEKESSADVVKSITSKRKKADADSDGNMTFEENRAGIERQISEIRELIEQAKVAEPVDLKTLAILQKTEADLRSKLNDKFGASEKSEEQYILVQPKFNTICPHTRRECWSQTKEFAMEHWHLIEDPNYKEK